MSQARVCYTRRVREKEFIMKVHKHLPKAIYKWKINDKDSIKTSFPNFLEIVKKLGAKIN